MSVFESKKHHLRKVLLYFFSVKSGVESHRLLVEAYGEAILTEPTCRDWFQCFKSDIDMESEERAGRPKLVEDAELEASLDEDPYQMQQLAESLEVARSIISMCLKALGIIEKQIEYRRN